MKTIIILKTLLLFAIATGALYGVCAAQEMQLPGQATYSVNVLKPAPLPATDENVRSLKLPAGFTVTKFAEGIAKPHALLSSPDGKSLYITNRDDGTIVMLSLANPTQSKTVRQKQDVHGMAFHDGRLYYVTVREVFSAPINPDGTLGQETKLISDLPDAGQHPDRTIGFGPDGLLYVSVGSTCNECEERNKENATMMRFKPDGTGREIFAIGLRNTIGFTWQPGTGALYGMDDGVDWLGNDAQREELNKIEQGKQYGWPYIFGDGQQNAYREPPNGVSLDQYDEMSVRPVLTWTAHASSMQLLFLSGKGWPAEYQHDALATMHGSCNRNPPSGYEVVRIHFENGQPVKVEPFLEGFLKQQGPEKWARFARPFGLAQLPDGSVLVGDEQNGVLYRIRYGQ